MGTSALVLTGIMRPVLIAKPDHVADSLLNSMRLSLAVTLSYGAGKPGEYIVKKLDMSNNTPRKKHWSIVEYLHETVKNPNIHINGRRSYYSDAWSGSFEQSVVRYLYGDEYSAATWVPQWPIDQLYIGDHVCIGAEAVILMGGNHTHRTDWFSLYPFPDVILDAYAGKGDTVIGDGAWIGMRAMIMPGVTIGEGAVIASGAIVTKDVAPYMIVAGNPAAAIRQRFSSETIAALLALGIYRWEEAKFDALKSFICADDVAALAAASSKYDAGLGAGGRA